MLDERQTTAATMNPHGLNNDLRGGDMTKTRIFVALAALLLTTNVLAGIFGNTIGPDQGTCTVALPPDGSTQLLSGTGNIIKFSIRHGKLGATCIMPDVSIWEDCCYDEDAELPRRAMHYTAEDYGSEGWDCIFRSAELGLDLATADYHTTVTPAGKVKLTCLFELDDD